MVKIFKFFPDLSPVNDHAIVTDEEDYLRMNNFEEFILSCHTEGMRFRPWQMASSKRM